jgi:hypothetical protein
MTVPQLTNVINIAWLGREMPDFGPKLIKFMSAEARRDG